MAEMLDLTGQIFGELTVLQEGPRNGSGKRQWICRCTCGVMKIVNQTHLRRGVIVSCGCWVRKRYGLLHRTHGMEGSPEYHVWEAMIQRCGNPRRPAYVYYGGRGIRVCPEWRESFETFIKDVGLRPGPEYSLDRIDVNGNYEPGNCRWATRSEQARNRRPRAKKAR